MINIYMDPGKFGLSTFGEIFWSQMAYEFDITVIFRLADGRYGYLCDSGCSCPVPFDGKGVDDVTAIASLSAFQEHCESHRIDYHDYPADAVARMLERLHAAGLR